MLPLPIPYNKTIKLQSATITISYDQDEVTIDGVIALFKDEQGCLYIQQSNGAVTEIIKKYNFYRIEAVG